MKPIISIVIPCYNHGIFINEAIQSVEQFPDKSVYEIIIINDGSTDAYTNKVLSNLSKKGYNVIFQENQGLGKSRNNGIKISKGEYILPLDADNKINPEYILKSIEILESNTKIGVVYGDAEYFGEKTGSWKVGHFDNKKILNGNFIDACAVFRKSVWVECKGYRENMPYQGWEDWSFWLSVLALNYRFYYIEEVMFYYRVLNNSMITHIANDAFKKKTLMCYIFYEHVNLYQDYLDPITAHANLTNTISVYENKINFLKNSNSYKIGKMIIKPFSMLNKFLNPKSFHNRPKL